jgi:nitroimidazol reductase NimA-like FMN-containing flavoprotein (pyridoxamine 5'-phosphate oxidase superfamily)
MLLDGDGLGQEFSRHFPCFRRQIRKLPVLFPVNFAVVADTIVVRTDDGSTIARHTSQPVAFEVDHLDEALHQGWSVLVRGQAHPVLQPGERRNVLASTNLRPWPRGEHDLVVRIVPNRITGRRLVDL